MAGIHIEAYDYDEDSSESQDSSGNYTMEATSAAGEERPFIRLIEPLQNVTKRTGQILKFKCQADGSPSSITYKWFKNEAPLSREKGKISIHNPDGSSRLRIVSLNPLDTGYYKCKASNTAGFVESTALVNVSAIVAKNRPMKHRGRLSGNRDLTVADDQDLDSYLTGHQRQDSLTLNHNQNGFLDPDSGSDGTLAGSKTCKIYDGQACSRYLAGKWIYVSDEPFHMMHTERIVLDASRVISNSSQVSEPCKRYAEKAACLHNYQICETPTSSTGVVLEPNVLQICKLDCVVVEKDLCPDEYTTARLQELVGQNRLLPDCSQLSEKVERCTKLLGDFDELPKPDQRCYSETGSTYRGTISTAESGKPCLKWLDVRRKFHEYKSSTFLELTDNNYCRNPAGAKSRPWCFTGNGTREFCNVPKCPDGYSIESGGTNKGLSRRGSSGFFDQNGFFAGLLPDSYSQYALAGAGFLGFLLVIGLVALICKLARSRNKIRSKKRLNATPKILKNSTTSNHHSKSPNGHHHTNGTIKAGKTSSNEQQQLELIHLMNGQQNSTYQQRLSCQQQGAGFQNFSAASVIGGGSANYVSHITYPDSQGTAYASSDGGGHLMSIQQQNSTLLPSLINELTCFVPRLASESMRLVEKLGEGQYGKVWRGEMQTLGYANASNITDDDCEYTEILLKSLQELADENLIKEFEQESMIMSRLQHPNIVRLLGVSTVDRTQCMVYEFVTHGDLPAFLSIRSPYGLSNNSHFDSLAAERILSDQIDFLHIATQIAAGMQYLAVNHYVHRDLAARNCLVTDRLSIKICDFASGRDIYSKDYSLMQNQKLLPIRWMAPESLIFGRFTEASDVWSLGVVLWEIFGYGSRPYGPYDDQTVIDSVRKRYLLERPHHCPTRFYSTMVECWHETPSRRPSFDELFKRFVSWSTACPSMVSSNGSPVASSGILGPLVTSTGISQSHFQIQQQQQQQLLNGRTDSLLSCTSSGVTYPVQDRNCHQNVANNLSNFSIQNFTNSNTCRNVARQSFSSNNANFNVLNSSNNVSLGSPNLTKMNNFSSNSTNGKIRTSICNGNQQQNQSYALATARDRLDTPLNMS